MAFVTLKHTAHTLDAVVYFYDGEAKVKSGLVEIPADRPEWAQRAWQFGYRLNAETGDLIGLADLVALCSAKSAEATADEGTDVGRQPTASNRLRKSQS